MKRRYILDSNALADLIYRRRGVYQRATTEQKRGAKIGSCSPVMGELYFGVENSSSRDENLVTLETGSRALRIWPYRIEEARLFGRLRAMLKKMGRPMQVVDIQLAAVAFSLGNCTVVTSDSDLSAIPGLSVENWATE